MCDLNQEDITSSANGTSKKIESLHDYLPKGAVSRATALLFLTILVHLRATKIEQPAADEELRYVLCTRMGSVGMTPLTNSSPERSKAACSISSSYQQTA